MGNFKWWLLERPRIVERRCKSLIHEFENSKGYGGLTINPYVGCSHRCVYCYATYDWIPDFYDVIEVKKNAEEVLTVELAERGRRTCPVFIASATDCYQPAEGIYRITRRCVEILQRLGIPYFILTKSSSIVRDLDIHASYRDKCIIAWSLISVDEEVKRMLEPNASPPSSILRAIRLFAERGLRVGVNIDPIIPGVNDEPYMLQRLVEEIARAGARYVSASFLRLRDDIWVRLKALLLSRGLERAVKKIEVLYFRRSTKRAHYYFVERSYASQVLRYVKDLAASNGLSFGLPIDIGHNMCHEEGVSKPVQTTLIAYEDVENPTQRS